MTEHNGCGKKHFGCHCQLCRAALERADVPPWAEALLSSALRIHGKEVRKIRRAIAALEEKRALYDPPETRAAYQHVIDGLRKHLATLEQPTEAERGA